jgi:hypothetical protein
LRCAEKQKKNERENVSQAEINALQKLARIIVEMDRKRRPLSGAKLAKA